MTGTDPRARFLRDRVLTATPAQRVVMLYDRLLLDLTHASAADSRPAAGPHLSHAMDIVAELLGSLDPSAGGPAENLASIYGFMLRELLAAHAGETARVAGVAEQARTLRAAWVHAAEQVRDEPRASASDPALVPAGAPLAAAGSWTG